LRRLTRAGDESSGASYICPGRQLASGAAAEDATHVSRGRLHVRGELGLKKENLVDVGRVERDVIGQGERSGGADELLNDPPVERDVGELLEGALGDVTTDGSRRRLGSRRGRGRVGGRDGAIDAIGATIGKRFLADSAAGELEELSVRLAAAGPRLPLWAPFAR
jgi:hypothetical protein